MQQPPSTPTSGAGGELRSEARQFGSKGADWLHGEADSRKAAAVSQARSVSSAIRQTADGLDESTPAWLKSAFLAGAQQIQRLADSIERKDSRQLMRDAQDFARNNPGTMLAACAVAGFAAARILKASGEQQDMQEFSHEEYEQGGHFSPSTPGEFDQAQPWGSGERDEFGQDERIDDTLGQGQRSAADAALAQAHSENRHRAENQSGRQFFGETAGEPFVARPESQSPASDESRNRDEDPLVLGTGGEAGHRLRDRRDIR
jgi:hypothetical protein